MIDYPTKPEIMTLAQNAEAWQAGQGKQIPEKGSTAWKEMFNGWLAQSPIADRFWDIARRNPDFDLWYFSEERRNFTDGYLTAELHDVFREMMAGKTDLRPHDPHWKNPFRFKIPSTDVDDVRLLAWDAARIKMAITAIAFMFGDRAQIVAGMFRDMEIVSAGYQCW